LLDIKELSSLPTSESLGFWALFIDEADLPIMPNRASPSECRDAPHLDWPPEQLAKAEG
jgi:hypothetical protein